MTTSVVPLPKTAGSLKGIAGAKITDRQLMDTAFAQCHRAGDLLEELALNQPQPANYHEQVKKVLRLLSEATCATQEMVNRAAGNIPPKVGT